MASKRRKHPRPRHARIDRRSTIITPERLERRFLPATLFYVTNTNDSGTGSLRYEIQQIDGSASLTGQIGIDFSLTGSGVHTISVSSALPAITKANVTVDGTSQIGYAAGAPVIAIDGTSAGSGASGLTFSAAGGAAVGLEIGHFSGNGILLNSSATGALITGDFIGVNAAGTAAAANAGDGIYDSGASVTIGGTTSALRNVISGSGGDGVYEAAANGLIEGNYIGTNAAGSAAIANGASGINVVSTGTTIGGTAAGARNVISGNATYGIADTTTGTIIQGNYIGTNAAGTAAVANHDGIKDVGGGGGSTIGGTTASAANVISGNTEYGIQAIYGGDVIEGDLIGTNSTGASAVPNGTGVYIYGTYIVIGGTTPNVISGNTTYGIDVEGNNDIVQGNYVGTNAAGGASVPNGTTGVYVYSSGDTIGGTTASARNVISGNTSNGIYITYLGNAHILGNYIGTNAAGSAAITGTHSAAGIFMDAFGVTIGGTTAGAGNVISGNNTGINDQLGNDTIQGNYIGTDQSGAFAVPNVEGIFEPGGFAGGTIGGTTFAARNVISGNSSYGIYYDSQGSASPVIEGNYIGTNQSGTSAVGNSTGFYIAAYSRSVTIGGATPNVISGNANDGIDVGSSNAIIQGNLIGTNAAGSAAVANGASGIYVTGTNNTIGGLTAPARNVISGNATYGIADAAAGTIIQGNYIGTNAAGTAAVANHDGIKDVGGGGGSTIGGTVAGSGNVISGNTEYGIQAIYGGDVIEGNVIGTDFTGSAAVPNGTGVYIYGTYIVIGGTTPNVISGNTTYGIDAEAANDIVQGNYVGTNAAGTAAVPNGAGVYVHAASVTVGGTTAATRNVISGNTGMGVGVSGSVSTGDLIEGDFIGLGSTGVNPLTNGAQGINVNAASGTIIGGTAAGAGNLIYGTTLDVFISSGSTGVQVLGNTIGLNVNGATLAGEGNANGVTIQSPSNTVGGTVSGARNVISGLFYGVQVILSAHNVVEGNYIGTTTSGSALPAGSDGNSGIEVDDSPNTTIGGTASGAGNVIAGYTDGISFSPNSGPSTGSLVEGNLIGLNAGATASIFTNYGILDNDSSITIGGTASGAGNYFGGEGNAAIFLNGSQNLIEGNAVGIVGLGGGTGIEIAGGTSNTIGGTASGAGNTVVAWEYDVVVQGSSTASTQIEGNFIGADGYGHLGQDLYGIEVLAGTGTTIGGASAGAGNVIGGDGAWGILLQSRGTTLGTLIQGNFIGTNAARSLTLGNGIGIEIDGSSGNTIGGSATGDGNVISGNNNGVLIQDDSGASVGDLIYGNKIGTDASGDVAIPNNVGIVISSSYDTVGGSVAGQGNLISGNSGQGIYVNGTGTTRGDLIAGNVIGLASNGTRLGNAGAGVEIYQAQGIVVGGPGLAANTIAGNSGDGVYILGGSAIGNVVAGNDIGTDALGHTGLGNGGDGVTILRGYGNIVGGTTAGTANVLSGNGGDGVSIGQETVGNAIEGNLIGTDPTGQHALANGGAGVYIAQAGNDSIVSNVVSGNSSEGIYIDNTLGFGTVIQGNLIGTDASGRTAIPNLYEGILAIQGTGITIGGRTPGQGNRISGNGNSSYFADGIDLDGSNVSQTLIQGNTIGLGALGGILANTSSGINLGDGGSDTVGGSNAGEGNVIAGNHGPGITIYASDVAFQSPSDVIQGNFIGTDANSDPDLGNTVDGIWIYGADKNTIGGSAPGAGNVISGNIADGIALSANGGLLPTGNVISGNKIGTTADGNGGLGNGQVGIELFNGATSNTIGGALAAEGNTISGNGIDGIALDPGSGFNVILNNTIGDTISNAHDGIFSQGSEENVIGAPGAGNVIDSNGDSGIELQPFEQVDNYGVQSFNKGDVVDQGTFFAAQSEGDPFATQYNSSPITFSISEDANRDTTGTLTFSLYNFNDNIYDGNILTAVIINGVSVPVSPLGGNDLDTIQFYTIPVSVSAGTLDAGGTANVEIDFVRESTPGAAGIDFASLDVTDASGGDVIQGNMIGTDQTLIPGLGNQNAGIFDAAGGNTIGAGVNSMGTPDLASGNLVVSNGNSGIYLDSIAGDQLRANLIGTDAAGDLGFGNGVGIFDYYSQGGNAIGAANDLGAGGSLVGGNLHGNVISGNNGAGLWIEGSDYSSAGHIAFDLVEGDLIGTDETGQDAVPNTVGVVVEDANGELIGNASSAATRDVISGNYGRFQDFAGDYVGGGDGVAFINSTDSGLTNTVIGTDFTGTSPIPNASSGVEIAGFSTGIVLGYAEPNGSNLISGNSGAGVAVDGRDTDGYGEVDDSIWIANDRIGTNLAGTSAIGNGGDGVLISEEDTVTVGGALAGEGNLISGNAGSGIEVAAGVQFSGPGTYSYGTLIEGNEIGTDVAGTSALPNASYGIEMLGGANYSTIGGDASAGGTPGNLISGNLAAGIYLVGGTFADQVDGNTIGTDLTGSVALGNHGAGVIVEGSGTGNDQNTIGGATPGAGNLISGNAGVGVQLTDEAGLDVIQANTIGTDRAGAYAIANGGGVSSTDSSSDSYLGNLISGNLGAGILLMGGSSSNLVSGNTIGTNLAGSAAIGNSGDGVAIADSSDNTVGGTTKAARNLISGNQGAGVSISDFSITAGNLIQGDYIGTDATGTIALGNRGDGVYISGSRTLGNVIGGFAPGAGDLISGNSGPGVLLTGSTGGNVVQGDTIGTDLTGTIALPNSNDGVWLEAGASSNTIGGEAAGDGNLISGNSGAGIALDDSLGGSIDDNVIQGNTIGADITGTLAVANVVAGIRFSGASGNNNDTIGGNDAAARNLISGNIGAGIDFYGAATGPMILGNTIGADRKGTGALPNIGDGITFESIAASWGVTQTVISGNLISGNSGVGIDLIRSATQTTILGNTIGADATGNAPLGNLGGGVAVVGGSNDSNTEVVSVDIGPDPSSQIGLLAEDSNDIAYNGSAASPEPGVSIYDPTSETYVLGNNIHDNTGPGIGGQGAIAQVSNLVVSSLGAGQYHYQFSASNLGTGPNEVDFYEVQPVVGQTFLAFTLIPAGDPAGTYSGSFSATLAPGSVFVATATDTGSGRSTSPFSSPAVLGGGAPPIPVASLPATLQAAVDLPAQFDGSASSDSGGFALTYAWDFGDGTAGTGVSPTHTYAKAGTYRAGLIVSDAFGDHSAEAFETVDVADSAPAFDASSFGSERTYSAPASTTGFGSDVVAVRLGDPDSGGSVFAVASAGSVVLESPDSTGAATESKGPTYPAPIGATYPAPIDDPSGASGDGFGSSMAVVGSLLAVSAPGTAGGGVVYLFDANPADYDPNLEGHLHPLATLTSPVGASDFGASMAGSGTRLLISASGTATTPGSAYVFDADPTSPTFGSELLTIADPAPSAGDGFGTAVASAGADLILTAPGSAGGSGLAYLVNGATGALVSTFHGSGGHFGASAASAGSDVLIGAPGASGGAGAVDEFAASGTLLKTIAAPFGTGGGFGSALAGGSTTALVGAPSATLGGGASGAAFQVDVDPTSPTFGSVLSALTDPAPSPGQGFGTSVAMLGNDAIVGLPGASEAESFAPGALIGLSGSAVAAGGGNTVVASGRIDSSGTSATEVQIAWGDGSTLTETLAAGVFSFAIPHAYAGTLAGTITASVGFAPASGAAFAATSTATLPISVAPAPAGLTIDLPSTIFEGTSTTLTGHYSGPEPAGPAQVVVDWGDGSTPTTEPISANGSFDFSVNHPYAHPGSDQVTAFVLGAGQVVASAAATAQVNALDPVFTSLTLDGSAGPLAISGAGTATLSASIAIPPGTSDSYTASIDWGDGSGPTTLHLAPGGPTLTLSATHPYVAGGSESVDPVVVSLSSDSGGSAVSAPLDVTLTPVETAPSAFINLTPGAAYQAPGQARTGAVVLTASAFPGVTTAAPVASYAWTVLSGGAAIGPANGSTFMVAPSGASGALVELTITAVGGATASAIADVRLQTLQDDHLTPTAAAGATELVVVNRGSGDTIDGSNSTVPVVFDSGPNGENALIGGPLTSVLISEGPSVLIGDPTPGTGPDFFEIDLVGNDPVVQAGGGSNTVDFSSSNFNNQVNQGVTLTLNGMTGVSQAVDSKGDVVTLNGTFQAVTGSTGGADSLSTGPGNVTVKTGTGKSTVNGGAGNDVIFGGPMATTTVHAGSGSTSVNGGAGNDVIFGGPMGSTTTVNAGSGTTSVNGGAGNDVIFGGPTGSTTTVNAGTGSTSVNGGAGNDVIFGGPMGSTTTVNAGSGTTSVNGGAGNDVIFGGPAGSTTTVAAGSGSTSVNGGAGNDVIFGGTVPSSTTTVNGGSGNTTVNAGSGQTTVNGGSGNDVIFGGTPTSTTTVNSGSGSTSVNGGAGNDVIFGGPAGSTTTVHAGSGGTTVNPSTNSGGSGNDVIFGGPGDIQITAGSGNSTIVAGTGNDLIYGGTGDDVIFGGPTVLGSTTVGTLGGNNSIYGGSGNDVIFGGPNTTLIQADGANGASGGSTTVYGGSGAGSIYGGSGNDVIFGGPNTSVIQAGTGNTTIYSGGSGGSIIGGSGNDVIFGLPVAGKTTSTGQGGSSTILGGTGNDVIFGGPNTSLIQASDDPAAAFASTTIYGASTGSPSTITGGSGNDVIFGGQDTTLIQTLDGPTTVYYGGGGGSIIAGSGDDTIFALPVAGKSTPSTGHGNSSTILGGSGNDVIYGGPDTSYVEAGSGPTRIVGYIPGNASYPAAPSTTTTLQGGTGFDTFEPGSGPTEIFAGSAGNSITGGPGLASLTIAADGQSRLNNLGLSTSVGGVPTFESITGISQIELAAGPGASIDASGYSGALTILAGSGDDALVGGTGADTFAFAGPSLGTDSVSIPGGAPRASLDFSGLDAGVFLDLRSASALDVSPGTGLRLSIADPEAIGTVLGSDYDDTILGNSGGDDLIGDGGLDSILGGSGNDTLQGGVSQVVYLDFDPSGSPSDHVFTDAERAAIEGILEQDYSAFSYTFVESPPASGPYATLDFNPGNLAANEGGIASGIDARNLDKGGVAAISVGSLLGEAGEPADTEANFLALTGEVAAHELGHLSGLVHGDSFGPIGSGIYSGVSPSQFYPMYTGPTGADESPDHILASPASLNTTIQDAISGTFFGEREDIVLAMNDHGTVLPTTTTAHSLDDVGSAQVVPLTTLAVPNTDRLNQSLGTVVQAAAADLTGTIAPGPDDDQGNPTGIPNFYALQGYAGDILNLQVASRTLGRIADPIDSILDVYYLDTATGQVLPVPFGSGVAHDDDSFQDQDAAIVDLPLPETTTYYIEVSTFPDDGLSSGQYELSMYTTTPVGTVADPDDPTQGVAAGDTLFGGAGDNLILASAGDDTIESDPTRDKVVLGSGVDRIISSVGVVSATLTPSIAPDPASGAVEVAEGTAVSFVGSYFDPDSLNDSATWSITEGESVVASGSGTSFSFTPGTPGTYRVDFQVSDSASSASASIELDASYAAAIVSAPSNQSASVGNDHAFSLGSFAAPAGTSGYNVDVSWGDGSPDTTFAAPTPAGFSTPVSLGNAPHTYAAPGNYTVTVSVGQGDYQAATASFQAAVASTTLLSINPVSPGVVGAPVGSIGLAFSGPVQTPFDSAISLTINGQAISTSTLTESADGPPGHYHINGLAALTGAQGLYTLTIDPTRALDPNGNPGGGGVQSVSWRLDEPSIAPSVAPDGTGVVRVGEGTALSFNGSFVDPSATSETWSVVEGGSIVASGTGTAFGFTPSNPGAYAVTFAVAEPLGTVSTTLQVVASYVAPVVTAPAAQSASAGASHSFGLGSYAAPAGVPGYSVDVSWGDGSPDATFAAPTAAGLSTPVSLGTAPHTYAAPGNYTVRVSVGQAGYTAGSASFQVAVPALQLNAIAPVSPSAVQSAISSVSATFSEAVQTPFNAAITLTLNGSTNISTASLTEAADPNTPGLYHINGLAALTNAEGSYTLTIDPTRADDTAGNPGTGSARSVSWVVDRTAPTSQVTPYPSSSGVATAPALTFPVSATGSDPAPSAGVVPSGVASYKLYYSANGGAYTYFATVPATSPSTTFTLAQSNNTYSFYSVAVDNAGNAQAYSPRSEAVIYVPDYSPPTTAITSVTPAASGSSTTGPATGFVISFTGHDNGSSGLAGFNLYESIDGASPVSLGVYDANPTASSPTNTAGSAYVAALADGASHSYRFWTDGVDLATPTANVEANPNLTATNPPDPRIKTATLTVAAPASLQADGLIVQQGAAQRSFIRYLEVDFPINNLTDAHDLAIEQLFNALPTSGAVSLVQHPLTGGTSGPRTVLKNGVAGGPTLSTSGNRLEIDFGVNGLGGSPSTSTADGWYELDITLNGQTQALYFDRILGDVDAFSVSGGTPYTVDANDLTEINNMLGQSGANLDADVDGNGVVNGTDKTLATRAVGHKLSAGLHLDD